MIEGNDGSRGWGSVGSNGGICEVNLKEQTVSDDILVDSISEMVLTISNDSSYTGAINSDGTTASVLSVTIDDTSTWTLSGDSYVTELSGNTENIVLNGYTLYVDGVAFE